MVAADAVGAETANGTEAAVGTIARIAAAEAMTCPVERNRRRNSITLM
jgi:hypothetical protein